MSIASLISDVLAAKDAVVQRDWLHAWQLEISIQQDVLKMFFPTDGSISFSASAAAPDETAKLSAACADCGVACDAYLAAPVPVAAGADDDVGKLGDGTILAALLKTLLPLILKFFI